MKIPLKKISINLNKREKILISLAVFILFIYLFVNLVWDPIAQSYSKIKEEYKTKREILDRYQAILSKGKNYENKFKQLESIKRELNRHLLPAEKPELASAKLQALIKEFAKDFDIEIERISPATPKELDNYYEITIRIPFNCYISELKDFLYKIENADVFLYVPSIDIRVPNPRRPNKIRVNMDVSGFIKKIKTEEKSKSKEEKTKKGSYKKEKRE